jgi:multidrug efflux system membrane fusion protein
LTLCVLTAAASECACRQQPHLPPAAVPVKVAAATRRAVSIELRAIGTMEANLSVDVKAQVGGILLEVAFREGDLVRRGQLLFRIDPEPFRVALALARARLRGDLARLKNAELALRRARGLSPDVVPQAELEKAQAERDAAAAAVATDRAEVRSARLSLGYCTIRSPIGGRAGNLLLHEGNLVKANADTPLVVLREISPIKVAFSIPERSFDEVRRSKRKAELELTVLPRDKSGPQTRRPAQGKLVFIDNTVNRATGTVLLKGLLPNSEEALWPGEFVDVSLRLGVRPGAIVIPSQAVQSGQRGDYVYRLKPDQTVEMRPVTLGPEAGGGAVVVERGISSGDLVVTDGQLRLRPGVLVKRAPEPRAAVGP